MNRLQTFTQALKSPFGWAGAILMAAVLVAPTMQGPEDYSNEWAESENMQAVINAEAASERREAAAWAPCREAHGEAVALWTADGDLVCRPRRGNSKGRVQL